MTKSQKQNILLGVLAIIVLGYFIYSFASKPTYEAQAGDRPFKGREDAAVVVTEYGDFQCPACAATVPLIDSLYDQYGDRIKIEYKHLPLTSIHPNAYNAALASECANDQGKFWELHDLMFANQNNLNSAGLKNMASQIGLDTALFDACLDSRARKDIVDADAAEAAQRGFRGTPTILLDGELVTNRAELENMIRVKLGLEPLQ
jgi:protein-disulfide isomerase